MRTAATRGRRVVRAAVATTVAALPLAAVLTVGSAAPLAPPLGACTGPDCPATWPSANNGDFTGRDPHLAQRRARPGMTPPATTPVAAVSCPPPVRATPRWCSAWRAPACSVSAAWP
ncbi:hypothetical protein [Streptomyces novaecaesareae]|uniref:hypothetical protein n=1 Tax=Streptomyces novaecaesareae TaxID=68244 RepID=UPI0014289A69|nr:hypothetical protein [Streptomyces novaecaesareae]